MLFTGFSAGALLVAHKMPLQRMVREAAQRRRKIWKIVYISLLQGLALLVVFVLPLNTMLSRGLLGFDTRWMQDSYMPMLALSFGIAAALCAGVILETVLGVGR